MRFFLGSVVFICSFLIPHLALSAVSSNKMTNVTAKRSAAGVAVDITFEKPVPARALKPAFERNFVQLVLKSTKVDAARMIPVAESEVQKIFAYPYSSDTARVRIILKRDNAWAKGRISLWNNSPKTVRIFVKDAVAAGGEISAIQKEDAPVNPAALKTAQALTPPANAGLEETSLLNEVVSNTKDIDIQNPDSVKAALGTRGAGFGSEKQEPARMAGDGPAELRGHSSKEPGAVGTPADPTKHFTRMAVALLGILGLFIGLAFGVKKYAGKLKKLPFGKKERLIQVVASHYLGNKKSISVVKVTGEYLVVGVSNEGISLISKLGAETNVEKYIEDRFWGGTFEKHLGSYAGDAHGARASIDMTKEIDLAELRGDSSYDASPAAITGYDGPKDLSAPMATAAAAITDKIALSPIRASIKEKLTKLKPLA